MSLILSGTDGLSDVDGSAATPAIRGTDANTGMFFPAADTIAFSEGGVESMRLNSSGILVTTNDASISGLTVGKGGGAVLYNTALGVGVGTNNTTGTFTAVGYATLTSNTTGTGNAGFGGNDGVRSAALQSNTTGSANSAFGHAALASNTTGANNTAVGLQALLLNTTASNNTAVGYQALYSATTGANNTAVGHLAGQAINNSGSNWASAFFGFVAGRYATGTDNTFLGAYSGGGVSNSGSNNVGIGGALYQNTSGSSNVSVGNYSLFSNTTGSFNVAVGLNALQSSAVRSGCTAVGHQALTSTASGDAMTAVGYQAGLNVAGSAGGFTAIGYQAGSNFTSGFNSTFIGSGTAAGAPTGNNEIVIGVNATGKGSATGFIQPGGGGVFQGNNSSTWSTTSDARIKENVQDITGLNIITALRPVSFDYIETKKSDVGFIAQEYITVLPDQVKKHTANEFEKELVGEDKIYGINPNLMPYLVKAIQELNAKIEAQALEIATLKGN